MTWLADLLRTICIPFAAITVAISLSVVRNELYRDFGQLFRFLALAVLNIAVALGDYASLGHPPRSWPALAGCTLGITLSLVGTSMIWWRSRHSRTM